MPGSKAPLHAVTCRWLSGDEFSLDPCATVGEVKIRAASAAQRLATDVEVLTVDRCVSLDNSQPAPDGVCIVVMKDHRYNALRAVEALKMHASFGDTAGVERCLATFGRDADAAASRGEELTAAGVREVTAAAGHTREQRGRCARRDSTSSDWASLGSVDELLFRACAQTCLHARDCDLVVFRTLYRYLQDVNRQDENTMTLLHRALRVRWTEVIDILLNDRRVLVNLAGPGSRTALHTCAKQGYESWLQRILAHYAREHTAEEVAIFVNAPDNTHTRALHDAATRDHGRIVDLILAVPGVDVNARMDAGWTALTLASMNNHVDVVRKLITHPDVDINARDNYGRSALHIAVRRGWVEIVAALVNAGIDVNAADDDHATALHDAAINGHVDIITLITAVNGLEVNACLADGRTALMKAAMFRLDLVVDKLLAMPNIDVNLQDSAGCTAEQLAQGRPQLAQRIADRGRELGANKMAGPGRELDGIT